MVRPLALVLLLAAAAPAQFIYGLNIHGKLTLNGTLLDSLPSAFDASNGMSPLERWWDLGIHGPDRIAMRLDGRVQKNGTKLFELPVAIGSNAIFAWVSLVVDLNGGVHMLRQDGEIALDGVATVIYPLGNSFFTRMAVDDSGTPYAIRGDGQAFKGTSTAVAGTYTASITGEPPDGTTVTTLWVDVAVDQLNGQLVALRADGKLFQISLGSLGSTGGTADGTQGPPAAVELAVLPFPVTPTQGDLYSRLVFANGEWRALRADGEVFSQASLVSPQVDYAGDGLSGEQLFSTMVFDGTDMRAVRGDGAVFQNLQGGTALFNLIGTDYRALATGTEPPDLSKFKNPPPKTATYKLLVPEGQTASLPILVSDIELLSDDLVVTENPDKPLPLGATFLEVDDGLGHKTRTIEWDGTQPVGTYKCPLMVADAKNKPVKFNEVIKVVALDSNPDNKNKAPKPLKPKTVQALVDHEVRIPVFGLDLDGDPLTFSVNPEKEPYKTLGATFDTETNEFVWTPTFDDIGTIHPTISVTDGTKTVKFTLGVKVISSLIFAPETP
jgi:hypothetical protein